MKKGYKRVRALGSPKIYCSCAWDLEKKLWYVHFVLRFSVWWWRDEVTMQVLCRQKDNKKWKILPEWCMERLFENMGSMKDSRGTTPRLGLLGYGLNCHKTQSFMKNGGQQKCLDKSPRRVDLLTRSCSENEQEEVSALFQEKRKKHWSWECQWGENYQRNKISY